MTETASVTATEQAMRGGAPARRWGSWFVAEHQLTLMRAYLQTMIFTAIGNPLVYLFALGIGLGALIGTIPGQDVPYLVFVAPALIASAAIMTASEEFTFPVMAGFKWFESFYAMNATPITGKQIVNGIVISVSIRLTAAAAVYYLILLAFGAIPGALGWLVVPISLLTALALGHVLMAYSATVTEDKGQFALVMRLIVTPMFLFSGTFFPLESLPVYLQWIGWVSPLWHGTQLGRVVGYGMVEPLWLTVVHVVYLVVLAVPAWLLAQRIVARRLDK